MIRAVGAVACAAAILTACAAPADTGDTAGASRHPTAHASTAPSTHANQPQSAMRIWYTTASPKIATLEQSITYAQWTVRRPAHQGLPAACGRVRTNARIAQALPPAPDRIVRRALSRQLSDFDTAAVLCIDGQLNGSGAAVNRGHRWAQVVNNRVLLLLGRD